MPWAFAFEGEVYREGDLTLEQVGRIERQLDDRSWLHIHPVRSAGDAIGVLSVMVSDRKGEAVADVAKRIGAYKPADFLALLTIEDEDDLPVEYRDGLPPEADEPSTST